MSECNFFNFFFYHSSCKNSLWIHISIIQTHDKTGTLGHLFFVYICFSCFGSKHAEHFLQKQYTVCAAFVDVDASFLERWLSGRSLFPLFLAFFLLFVDSVQLLVTDSFEFKPAISEDG